MPITIDGQAPIESIQNFITKFFASASVWMVEKEFELIVLIGFFYVLLSILVNVVVLTTTIALVCLVFNVPAAIASKPVEVGGYKYGYGNGILPLTVNNRTGPMQSLGQGVGNVAKLDGKYAISLTTWNSVFSWIIVGLGIAVFVLLIIAALLYTGVRTGRYILRSNNSNMKEWGMSKFFKGLLWGACTILLLGFGYAILTLISFVFCYIVLLISNVMFEGWYGAILTNSIESQLLPVGSGAQVVSYGVVNGVAGKYDYTQFYVPGINLLQSNNLVINRPSGNVVLTQVNFVSYTMFCILQVFGFGPTLGANNIFINPMSGTYFLRMAAYNFVGFALIPWWIFAFVVLFYLGTKFIKFMFKAISRVIMLILGFVALILLSIWALFDGGEKLKAELKVVLRWFMFNGIFIAVMTMWATLTIICVMTFNSIGQAIVHYWAVPLAHSTAANSTVSSNVFNSSNVVDGANTVNTLTNSSQGSVIQGIFGAASGFVGAQIINVVLTSAGFIITAYIMEQFYNKYVVKFLRPNNSDSIFSFNGLSDDFKNKAMTAAGIAGATMVGGYFVGEGLAQRASAPIRANITKHFIEKSNKDRTNQILKNINPTNDTESTFVYAKGRHGKYDQLVAVANKDGTLNFNADISARQIDKWRKQIDKDPSLFKVKTSGENGLSTSDLNSSLQNSIKNKLNTIAYENQSLDKVKYATARKNEWNSFLINQDRTQFIDKMTIKAHDKDAFSQHVLHSNAAISKSSKNGVQSFINSQVKDDDVSLSQLQNSARILDEYYEQSGADKNKFMDLINHDPSFKDTGLDTDGLFDLESNGTSLDKVISNSEQAFVNQLKLGNTRFSNAVRPNDWNKLTKSAKSMGISLDQINNATNLAQRQSVLQELRNRKTNSTFDFKTQEKLLDENQRILIDTKANANRTMFYGLQLGAVGAALGGIDPLVRSSNFGSSSKLTHISDQLKQQNMTKSIFGAGLMSWFSIEGYQEIERERQATKEAINELNAKIEGLKDPNADDKKKNH